MKKRVSKILNTSTTFTKIEKIQDEELSSKNLIDILFSIDEKDISSSFIISLFGEFNGKAICNPYDIIKVPKGLYHNNKNEFTTTVGCWVFNKFFIDHDLFNELGYINKTIDKKLFNKLNRQLSYAIMEDRITTQQLAYFEQKTQMFMRFESILTPNHSEEMLTCTNKINKKKDQLFKQYQKEIDSGNVAVVEDIENQLLDYAKELLGDDPALDTYLSGAQGDFDNNFKNMFIMNGAVRNPDPLAENQYNIIKSNFVDGIAAEDYSTMANSLSAGPYARGKKTEVGGYWEKLLLSATQHLVAGKPDSDCGSINYVTVELTSDNLNDWIYSYIITNNGLVELTSQNASKYIGKKLKFRFSSMCKSKDCICNKCLGNFFYRMGKTNIGVMTPQIASKLKLISMKSFHSSVIRTVEIDPIDAFSLK